MKTTSPASKIKTLRQRLALSQEELANKCKLSLRTIQRIETGETTARGDTLRRLAEALNTIPEELTNQEISVNNTHLVWMNLSAFGFLIFPLLGLILPLAFWSLEKDNKEQVDAVGKRIINFQISWLIVLFLIYLIVVGPVLGLFRVTNIEGNIFTFLSLIGALYLYNIVMISLNSLRSLRGRQVIYQPAIPFLR
jgi:uncharacterized Tic20 family protein